MHIPDGFLGPKTCLACYAAVAPFWVVAWRGLKRRLEFSYEVPYVALASAFVFVLMLFNVPIPGGTSGHAVGTALVTIALGVGPAILAVSIALLIQALLFQDGGITAFGANALNMAVVQALVAAGVWKLTGPKHEDANSGRVFAGAFAAGYGAALISAVTTGIQLGLQPVVERGSDGLPQYFPIGLGVTLPAMVISHLFVGVLEGAVTGFAVSYLFRMPHFSTGLNRGVAARGPAAGVDLVPAVPASTFMGRKSFWAGAAALVLAVPLGLWLPAAVKAAEPWGEWNPTETAEQAGLKEVPTGMARLSEIWEAPVPDYGWGAAAGTVGEAVQYVASAALGVMALALLFWGIGWWQKRQVRSAA